MDIAVPGEEINVDCLWRAERLVVELDSRRYHRDNPAAFTRDRRRDRLLRLASYDPVRFTDEELEHEPDEVIATVIHLLAKAGASARPTAFYRTSNPSSPSGSSAKVSTRSTSASGGPSSA